MRGHRSPIRSDCATKSTDAMLQDWYHRKTIWRTIPQVGGALPHPHQLLHPVFQKGHGPAPKIQSTQQFPSALCKWKGWKRKGKVKHPKTCIQQEDGSKRHVYRLPNQGWKALLDPRFQRILDCPLGEKNGRVRQEDLLLNGNSEIDT